MDYDDLRLYAESLGFFAKYIYFRKDRIGIFQLGDFKKKYKILEVFTLQDAHKVLKIYETTGIFRII